MNDKRTEIFFFHRKSDSSFHRLSARAAGSRRRLLLLTLILGLLQAGAGEYQAAEDSGGKADGSPEVYQTLYMDGNLFKELTNRISDTGLYVSSFSSCGQSAPLYIHKDGGDGLENIWAAENNGADPVYCMPPVEALGHISDSWETYFVVRLSDPLLAQKCVETLLPRPWAYMGFAADESRMALVKKRLLQKGFAPGRVDKIQKSMGLDIGAVTPQERALAILAELVSVRRTKAGLGHYPKAMLELAKSGESVLATVVQSDGLPAVGEKLLFTTGEQIGSLGGNEEQAVRSAALKLLKTKETVKLLQQDGITVLLERMELTC